MSLRKTVLYFAALIAVVIATGCGKTVSYRLSDEYAISSPKSVAILPLASDVKNADRESLQLFRSAIYSKLKEKNFRVLPLTIVDDAAVKLGVDYVAHMKPNEAAALFKTDAVLYGTLSDWDVDAFVTYASLKVGASFALYSSDGTRLWKASYDTTERDTRFDKTQLELAVVKAYEPRIQRIVDAVFYTLPPVKIMSEKKRYYDWLP
jgi:hypothetical protein